jgi:hypothetical protein
MMMKKLLVLLLVLGIASATNASLLWCDSGGLEISSVDIPVGGSVTVYLKSDANNLSMVNWVGPSDGSWDGSAKALVSGGSAYAAAGNSASFNGSDPLGYTGWGRGESKTGDPDLAPISLGIWYSVVISANGVNGDSMQMHSDYYATDEGRVEDLLTVNIIPEPITVALLSLGGLFLRRRK